MCNPYAPVQSKHTFCFSHLFIKKGSRGVPNGVNLGVIVGPKCDIWSKQGVPKSGSKKVPPKVKPDTIPGSGGPWSGGLVCALFRQETVARAAAEALFEILAEKDGLCSTLLQKKWSGLKIVAKERRECWQMSTVENYCKC